MIIGGVAAGASAAAKARRCDENARIVVFEKGKDISYATCGLPYYLSGVIANRKKLLVTKASFFEKRFKVTVHTEHEVTAIGREGSGVEYINHATGKKGWETYDRLIIAPGSSPIIPPIPGCNLPFVFTLKTLEDTDRIHHHLHENKPSRAVIIGAGLIGLETAENLVHAGLQVSVVEAAPHILPFMDQEMAEMLQAHSAKEGLTYHLSDPVAAIYEDGKRGLVETKSGKTLEADLVIIAAGIRPNIELAKNAGLAIGEAGGIVVDEYMRTSDPAIYAAGDCVESINLVTGKSMIFPMGAAANKQGRAAGANAVGGNIKVKGFTGTVIVKLFEQTAAKTGLSEREALAEGYTPYLSYILALHHAGYYPGGKDIRLKTICDADTGRILGAQAIGQEGVDKRIDIMATAIYAKMNIEDLMHLDLAYAPPYSSARDPIFVSGAVGQNFYSGQWIPISPSALHTQMNNGEEMVLLDVRTEKEVQKTGIIPGALNIPIDELRDRIDELDQEKKIVLYCAIGLRSYLGYRILKMKGFDNISALSGGIGCWTYPLKPVPNQ